MTDLSEETITQEQAAAREKLAKEAGAFVRSHAQLLRDCGLERATVRTEMGTVTLRVKAQEDVLE